MLVGIGITGSFISGLAAGLTRSDKGTKRKRSEQILKIRLARERLLKLWIYKN
jgi:hypothetical protein